MRKLIWLMLLASAWSNAAERNVTLTPIITPIMLADAEPVAQIVAPAPQPAVTQSITYDTSVPVQCQEVESVLAYSGGNPSAINQLNPLGSLYLNFKWPLDKFAFDKITTGVLVPPAHGRVTPQILGSYLYEANIEADGKPYQGADTVVFWVQIEGKYYKVTQNLAVVPTAEGEPPACSTMKFEVSELNGDELQEVLKQQVLTSINVQISNLLGGAVAQTVGNTITLDDNAAGNGWNTNWTSTTDWLPTSNPYEWKAREGSDAYGKMDLLSVMLHEYGHVLGIEHSANSGDYMSTTLSAGTRKLPSPEEMQLMANLVAGVKDSLPSDPGIPLPSIPLALGALAFARRREDVNGFTSVAGAGSAGATDALHYTVDYQVASNSELQGLDSPNKWLVSGNVNFAGISATLGEAARTQTRLNQIFVVNPGDTTLTFTLNPSLTDQSGPDDAFEVALLDANTGANLLGGIGLTHSDAFLNIQGSGVERRASQVTRSVNADGSVTYMVDISAIAAGTTVNLSFDMIGFAESNSTITVSQVQMGAILAIAANDSVMATEDQAIHFNALSNDLHTQGYSPLIVVAPQHGVVTINVNRPGFSRHI